MMRNSDWNDLGAFVKRLLLLMLGWVLLNVVVGLIIAAAMGMWP